MGLPMNMRFLGVLIACVSQFSEPLRANNYAARRIFGDFIAGKTMFYGSVIFNPVLSTWKKNRNQCHLGDTTPVESAVERECRKNFFKGDWM